jgi:hypothetical protein
MLLRTRAATSIGTGSPGKAARQMLAAAVEHRRGVVDGVGRARALEHVVARLAAGDSRTASTASSLRHVDDVVGAELRPILRRLSRVPVRITGWRRAPWPRHAHQADRARAHDHHALAGDQPAELGQPVHRGAGGDDQRRLLVAHVVGDMTSVLMLLTCVFAEAAVGGEAVGAVALVRRRRSSCRSCGRRCTCPRGSACTGRSRRGSRP